MIFVDTNVFVLALRYPRDANAGTNDRFLEHIAARGNAVTGPVNVLETCGILSFNLNRQQLTELHSHFARRFSVRIVGGLGLGPLLGVDTDDILRYMARKTSFGDALVAHAADRWAPEADLFASWDARHFAGKIAVRALTPAQILKSAGEGAAFE